MKRNTFALDLLRPGISVGHTIETMYIRWRISPSQMPVEDLKTIIDSCRKVEEAAQTMLKQLHNIDY